VGFVNELVEYKGYYCGTTNKSQLKLLYSIKNRKYIKGYIKGDRVSGDISYRVYPGTYLVLDYFYWNKADPPHSITITLIKIGKDGVERLKTVEVRFYTKAMLENMPPQLLDLYKEAPGYHTGVFLSKLFEKQYSEDEHLALIQLLDKGKIVEGEEHE
jgi:hypothetical protein